MIVLSPDSDNSNMCSEPIDQSETDQAVTMNANNYKLPVMTVCQAKFVIKNKIVFSHAIFPASNDHI